MKLTKVEKNFCFVSEQSLTSGYSDVNATFSESVFFCLEELVEFHCQWTNVILNRTEYQRATAFISRPAVLSVKPHQSVRLLFRQ
jgi:hypothetical protein